MLQQLAQLYSYNYSVSGSSSSHLSTGLLVGLILVGLPLLIFEVVCLWKVFVKAGRPGWTAIIPIYNYWVLFEIAGKPGWWSLTVLLSIIPLVGWVVFFGLYIFTMIALAKRFGKSTVFAVVGLVIFSIVGIAILALGDAKYKSEDLSADSTVPPKPLTPPAPIAPQPPTAA